MIERLINNAVVVSAYTHLTHEIIQLPEVVNATEIDVILTGFYTSSLLEHLRSKFTDRSVVYAFGGTYEVSFVKVVPVEFTPIKLIITNAHVILTSANLTLSSYKEISFAFVRNDCILTLARRLISGLKQLKQLKVVNI